MLMVHGRRSMLWWFRNGDDVCDVGVVVMEKV